MTQRLYEIYVSNIGHVESMRTHYVNQAAARYNDWVRETKLPHGRASGEDVTLMCDGEIIREHQGKQNKDDDLPLHKDQRK